MCTLQIKLFADGTHTVVCLFVELESILLAERVRILYLICMSVSINTGIKSEFMLQFK